MKYLYEEIGKILGLDKKHNMIIIGGGNLGQALANYVDFEKRGFYIKGIFDVNPVLKGLSVRGIQIHMLEDLESFIKDEEIQIAALTLPKSKAEEMTRLLVRYGIKAIWNFAHIDLDVPSDVLVENVHLSESLMRFLTISHGMRKSTPVPDGVPEVTSHKRELMGSLLRADAYIKDSEECQT